MIYITDDIINFEIKPLIIPKLNNTTIRIAIEKFVKGGKS